MGHEPVRWGYSLNAVGRLAAMQYQPVAGTTVQEMYSYQTDGRLTKKRLRWKRGSTQQDLEASYTFDSEGRPSTLTYPDGSVVTYAYNTLGQLYQLKQGSTVLATAGYGPAGELLTFNDETRQYNALLQMTRMYTADRFMDLVYSYPAGTNNGQVSSATVAGTGGVVYQDQRYGTFSYSFAVPNGSYRVRLKFAELYYGNAGSSGTFNVDLNGTRVLTNFDAYAAASGQNQGVDREFAVTVTGGQIQIAFTAVTDNPIVNGIEIVGTVGSGFTPIRVNAGGGAYTDDRGVVWSADSGYAGGLDVWDRGNGRRARR